MGYGGEGGLKSRTGIRGITYASITNPITWEVEED
jgi:hypothetical protein